VKNPFGYIREGFVILSASIILEAKRDSTCFKRGIEMKTLCIINPVAGKGRAIQAWRSVQGELRQIYSKLDLEYTSCAGDATLVAREAVNKGYQLVIVFGGDGTLNEVVNGLAGSDTALAIVPSGSGNDFARSLGLSKDPKQAIATIAVSKKKRLDLGRFAGRYFLNMGGLGFDADVAHRINGKRLLRGQLAYLIAVLQALGAYDSYRVELRIDDQKLEEETIMVSVGNGQYAGGGFRLLPHASLEDGLLDIMVVRKTSRLDIISTLPALYKGTHLGHPKCSFYRGREVNINLLEPNKKVFAQVDGQEFQEFPLEFGIIPGALQVIVP